jgi:translation initiation factor IF-2
MAEKRVHEIAKERGMSASDALLKLRAAGMDVTATASVVDEAEALRALGANGAATAAPPRPAAGQRTAAPAQRAGSGAPPTQRPAQPGQRPAAPGQRPAQPAARAAAQAGAAQERPQRRVFEPDGPPLKVTPRSQREEERPRPILPPRPPAQARGPQQAGRPAQRAAAPQQRRPADGAQPRPAAPVEAQPQPQARQAAPVEPQPQPQAPQAAPAPAAPQPEAPAPQATPAPAAPQPEAPAPQATPAQAPAQQPQARQAAPAQPAAREAAPQRPGRPAARAPQQRQAAPQPPPRPSPPAARQAAVPTDPRRGQAQAPVRAAQAPPAAEAVAPAPAEEAQPARRQDGPQARGRKAAGPKITPTEGTPAPGTGPKIIAAPEPEKRPTRDETQSKPSAPGGRPNRGGLRTERGPGAGTRRVVIDSQASRRGPGGGPGGPGGGPGGPQQRPRRRGRRRRDVLAEEASPLDQQAASRTDVVRVNSGSTVKDIAEYLGVPVPEIIKQLMTMGEMVTLTQTLSDEAISVLAEALDKQVEVVHADSADEQEPAFEDAEEDLVERPPVVTIMGHVDHGKTSLLDAIRQTNVVKGEAGGITQHIGAYQVQHDGRTITFLDTPGHEAFTAMRARGARVTDVAVIVVAADDGVKPQTDEAIDHSKAAEVPILVAVNKIDKEGADPTRVRTELTQRGLQPAEWGGDTEFVDVSAKTHDGLEDLLETILVVTELEDLKANPDVEASGVVIESKLDPGRGPVVTVLIQRGTLEVGDAIVAGSHWGKVRAMQDYQGERLKEAVPGQPVEILGFDGVPDAGDTFRVVENDRTARQQANERAVRLRNEAEARRAGRKVSFDEIFRGIQEGAVQELNLVLKADVSGSLEAFEDEIARLPQSEVQVNVVRSGVGGISESDVMLAAASDAVILGFNVRPVGDARAAAEREGVEIRSYSVIYNALDDLRDAMQGMLAPEEVEETVGTAEVRATFRASRVGTIAGCMVTDGTIRRNAKVRIVRDGTVIYDTTIDSLKRFNEDVREVATGFECGIVLANYQDIKEGDVLEAYETRKVERALS